MQASDTPIGHSGTPMLSIRHVSHGSGLSWLAGGWSCFRSKWQPLVVLSAGMYVLMFVLSHAGAILFPILAIFYLATVAAYRRMGQQGEVFLAGSGVLRNSSLWALAVTLAIVSMAVVALVAAFAVGVMMKGAYSGAHLSKGVFYWFAGGQLVLTLLLSTLWMAPALIVQRGAGVVQALRLSVMGSLRNPLSFLTVALLGALMTALALIPLGLGLIVAMPVLACAAAQAAEDIVA